MMKNKRTSKRDKLKDIKVTYISSPVKVKTNASNFRALVQELTGQDSNVAEITNLPLDGKYCDDYERVNKGTSSYEQWRVDEASLLKPDDYSEFLSRSSFVEPLNQHLDEFDLLSFDMS